jgi:hypothetical protein
MALLFKLIYLKNLIKQIDFKNQIKNYKLYNTYKFSGKVKCGSEKIRIKNFKILNVN